MKIISLKCNNCSADLEIPENTNFFNCSFCNSSLAIKRSGKAIFTEVLSGIKEDTGQILDLSENILIEKKIARLDRDWEQTQEKYKTYHKNGSYSLPGDKQQSINAFILMALFPIIAIAIFSFNNSFKQKRVSQVPFPQNNPALHIENYDDLSPSTKKLLEKNNPQILHTPGSRLPKASTPPFGMLLLGLAFTFFIFVFASSGKSAEAKEYQAAKRKYQTERAHLLQQLE